MADTAIKLNFHFHFHSYQGLIEACIENVLALQLLYTSGVLENIFLI